MSELEPEAEATPTVREQLAAAASTVEGVSCHPYYVQGTQAGLAWLKRERVEATKFGALGRWNVVVVLPQDMAAAERLADELAPQLVDALAPVLAVTSWQRASLRIPNSAGDLPVLYINGHREEDPS